MTLPTSRRTYWVALHLLVVPLFAACAFWLVMALRPGGAPPPIARDAASLAASVPWLFLALGLVFGSYGGRHRWIWLAMGLLAVAQVVTAFLGYLLPYGQVSFWLAARGIAFPPGQVIGMAALISATGLALLHLVWLARADPDQTYWGRYTRIGLIAVALLAGLQVAALAVEFTATQALLERYGSPGAGGAALPADPSALPSALASNPLSVPAHVVPDWNVLPVYAVLRAVPHRELGVLAAGGFLLVWLALPWLDRGRPGAAWSRPGVRWILLTAALSVVLLGILGAMPADPAVLWTTRAIALACVLLLVLLLPRLSRRQT